MIRPNGTSQRKNRNATPPAMSPPPASCSLLIACRAAEPAGISSARPRKSASRSATSAFRAATSAFRAAHLSDFGAATSSFRDVRLSDTELQLRVRIVRRAILEGQDRRVLDHAVADLDGSPDGLVGLPG